MLVPGRWRSTTDFTTCSSHSFRPTAAAAAAASRQLRNHAATARVAISATIRFPNCWKGQRIR